MNVLLNDYKKVHLFYHDRFQAPDILEITRDTALIRRVLFTSKAVVITDDGVRPNVRPEQTTLILRDIPSDTPSEKVAEIFATCPVPCPNVISLRSETNDTWYVQSLLDSVCVTIKHELFSYITSRFVTFSTEAEVRDALVACRSARFEGRPVKARLKTDSASNTTKRQYFG